MRKPAFSLFRFRAKAIGLRIADVLTGICEVMH